MPTTFLFQTIRLPSSLHSRPSTTFLIPNLSSGKSIGSLPPEEYLSSTKNRFAKASTCAFGEGRPYFAGGKRYLKQLSSSTSSPKSEKAKPMPALSRHHSVFLLGKRHSTSSKQQKPPSPSSHSD